MSITHAKVSIDPDGPDPTQVRPSDWNANHIVGSGAIQSGMIAPNSVTSGIVASGAVLFSGIAYLASAQTFIQPQIIIMSGAPSSGVNRTLYNKSTYSVAPTGQAIIQALNSDTFVRWDDDSLSSQIASFTCFLTMDTPVGTLPAVTLGGEFHVLKTSGIVDSTVVALQVGMHKVPALGSAANIGVDIYSADNAPATGTTRAGDAIRIEGAAGWTNALVFYDTDTSLLFNIDKNGIINAWNNADANVEHVFKVGKTTPQTLRLTFRDYDGTNIVKLLKDSANTFKIVNGAETASLLSINSSGQIILQPGPSSATIFNNQSGAEVFRIQVNSPHFKFNEGTASGGSAVLGTNCPAVYPTSGPYTWVAVASADDTTVYIPAWK